MSKEIQLTQGYVVIVDDEDYEYLIQWKWHYNGGYAKRTDNKEKKSIKMHNQIINPKEGFIIDHRDGNRLNNQRLNLRECTQNKNAKNVTKKKSNATSIYKGVTFSEKMNKWKVGIRNNGKLTHLGYYDDEKIAGRIYNYYAKIYFEEFAYLNDLPEINEEEVAKLREKNYTSKYKGVNYSYTNKKFIARITENKKRKNLGYFKTEEEAHNAILDYQLSNK